MENQSYFRGETLNSGPHSSLFSLDPASLVSSYTRVYLSMAGQGGVQDMVQKTPGTAGRVDEVDTVMSTEEGATAQLQPTSRESPAGAKGKSDVGVRPALPGSPPRMPLSAVP